MEKIIAKVMEWNTFWQSEPYPALQENPPSPTSPALAVDLFDGEVRSFALCNMPALTSFDEVKSFFQGYELEPIYDDTGNGSTGVRAYNLKALTQKEIKFEIELDINAKGEFDGPFPRKMSHTEQDLRYELKRLGWSRESFLWSYRQGYGPRKVKFPFLKRYERTFLPSHDEPCTEWTIEPLFSLSAGPFTHLFIDGGEMMWIYRVQELRIHDQIVYLPLEDHAIDELGLWSVLGAFWHEADFNPPAPSMSRQERNRLIKSLHQNEGMTRREARFAGFRHWRIANGEKDDEYKTRYQAYKERLIQKHSTDWEAAKSDFLRKWGDAPHLTW